MSCRGKQYRLTLIHVLTNDVMYVPLVDKSAVINAYLKEKYCRFRGSKKVLADNGSEFKNLLSSEVALQLGI